MSHAQCSLVDTRSGPIPSLRHSQEVKSAVLAAHQYRGRSGFQISLERL